MRVQDTESPLYLTSEGVICLKISILDAGQDSEYASKVEWLKIGFSKNLGVYVAVPQKKEIKMLIIDDDISMRNLKACIWNIKTFKT